MKTLVVGLGNPLLSDDGIGWRVAEEVQRRLPAAVGGAILPGGTEVEVDCLSLGGLTLMERLIGYQRAILIDAIATGQSPTGTVTSFPLEALPARPAGHTRSVHDTSLQDALQVGLSLGAELPKQVEVVAIEAHNLYTFSEELSPEVAAALPLAAAVVLDLLKEEAR